MNLYPKVPQEVLEEIAPFNIGLILKQFMLTAKASGFDEAAFTQQYQLGERYVPHILSLGRFSLI